MSSKQTIRYPEEVVDIVEEDIDDYFSSKSDFFRFASKYLIDEMGIRDFDDQEYNEMKDDLGYLLDNNEAIVDEDPSEGITAVNKVYAGYALNDPVMLQEGVISLSSTTSNPEAVKRAEEGIESVIEKIEENIDSL